jgi:ubiquinone/menaquinone biosynthesis C-methylase UbiE
VNDAHDPSRHDHDHDHDHGERYTGDFDEMAKTWDADPAKVERARVIADLLPQRLALAPTTRVFEYGAGTGLVSQMLAPHVGPLTLADPSAGMRDAMAAKVDDGTLPPDTRIWSTDLSTDPTPDERFELVVTVQVLHHVDDLPPVLAAFAAITEPGGTLAVVDLDAEDGSFHGEGFGGHHGFHHPELTAQIQAAGFGEVRFEHAYDLEKNGDRYPLFLALATR